MTTLRLATRDDVPALRDLIARSAIGLSEPFYTREQIDALNRYVYGVDTQLVDDGTYFVIEDDGVPVACGGWSKRRTLYGGDQMKREADPLLDPAAEPARIRAFFVDPAHGRRGLGRQLLDACAAAARAAGFRRLALVATLPGEPLYLACGFTMLDRFDIDMPNGVKAPVSNMTKDL